MKKSNIQKGGFFERVYRLVQEIPEGEVRTYGQIARRLGTRDARRVGQALHANKSEQVPCHRVVFADGSMAPGYAFGGPGAQSKKLAAEGVTIRKGKAKIKAGNNP